LAYHDRMPTRTYMGKCPPGVICVTPAYTLLMGLVVLGIGIAVFLFTRRPILQVAPQPVYNEEPPVAIQIAAGQSGDDRYTRAPKPERHWITQPDLPIVSEM